MRSTLRRPMPALQIGYHDHCFDGVASAAAFLRFYRDKVKPGLTDVGLRGLAHRAGQLFDPDVFAGEENAVVDFRFSPDPRLTWWFDHHQSAFESASDEAVFHADRSGRKFWDPQAKSCTRFLARVVEEKFGWDPSPLRELIDWAEIIDGALFSTPQMAVKKSAPSIDRKSTRLNSSHDQISYAVFCLKKKNHQGGAQGVGLVGIAERRLFVQEVVGPMELHLDGTDLTCALGQALTVRNDQHHPYVVAE